MNPNFIDLEQPYTKGFEGMTKARVSLDDLLEIRERLFVDSRKKEVGCGMSRIETAAAMIWLDRRQPHCRVSRPTHAACSITVDAGRQLAKLKLEGLRFVGS